MNVPMTCKTRGGDRPNKAERRRRQPGDDEADAEGKILVDDRARATRKLHQKRQPLQVIVHQRNSRAVDGHFAAAAPIAMRGRPPPAPARRSRRHR